MPSYPKYVFDQDKLNQRLDEKTHIPNAPVNIYEIEY